MSGVGAEEVGRPLDRVDVDLVRILPAEGARDDEPEACLAAALGSDQDDVGAAVQPCENTLQINRINPMIRQFSYLLPGFQLLHLGHEPDGGNLLPFALAPCIKDLSLYHLSLEY